MNHSLKPNRTRHWTVLAVGLLILMNHVGAAHARQDARVDTVRFDVILELNAPLLQTNVLLFARYWVAADHYNIGIVWAEPFAGGINFATMPMTLTVDSNPESFSITSQVQPELTSTFAKPVGKRGIFLHKFNSYAIADLRFAESEALASRIYLRDLNDVPNDTNDVSWPCSVAESPEQSVRRRVARMQVRRDRGYVTRANLVDANDQLIEHTRYEYSDENGRKRLRKQTALLPETFLTVGFSGKGATITINDQKRTFKQLPTSHHEGGRECTVDYDPFQINDSQLAMPSSIVVRKANENTMLRMAHMLNYVRLKLTAKEAERAAREFAHLDAKEQAVQELLERYWLKENSATTDEDATALNALRAHFQDLPSRGKPAGEQLKRLNLLMRLDWIQGDPRLPQHFREYLATLTANGLQETRLSAGGEFIHLTARWHQFTATDEMTEQWLNTVIAVRDPSPTDILAYAESQFRRRRYWIAVRLLEASLERQDWGSGKLAGQVLKCKALEQLHKALRSPSSPKIQTVVKAQAAWAARSCGTENVAKAFQSALSEADRTFSSLRQPTRKQRILGRELEAMKKTARSRESSSSGG